MSEKVMGKNLFETYEVNNIQYTDNIPSDFLIGISKKEFIEYQQQKEEIERLKLHIMKIKEVISTWNIENDEGHNEFKIPKKIIDVVWGDKE